MFILQGDNRDQFAVDSGKIIPNCGRIKAEGKKDLAEKRQRENVLGKLQNAIVCQQSDKRSATLRTRVTNYERQKFTEWRQRNGFTLSQALRFLILRQIQFGKGSSLVVSKKTRRKYRNQSAQN
jgi:hypothetical protein